MTSIGLDIGTGFVKCVSDGIRIKFPSLYAYRHPARWEDRKGVIEAVGYAAVKLSENPDAVVIRPVMQGRPVNEKGFEGLAKKAVELAVQERVAMGQQGPAGLGIVVGLPYEARAHSSSIRKIILRLFRPKYCRVVPQVLGTLVDVQISDAIVVSIGQGTTEIVAFRDSMPIKGVSIHHAVNDITSRLGGGKTSYLDDAIFADSRIKPLVGMLADSIVDDLHAIRQDLAGLPVVISGGGIMVPGAKEAIVSRFGHDDDIIIPQDPVMSNAQGLFHLAKSC